MKQQIYQQIIEAVRSLGIEVSDADLKKIQVEYPESALGDYSSNAALILSKTAKLSPLELAKKIIERLDQAQFAVIETAGPGFINFKLKTQVLVDLIGKPEARPSISSELASSGKILLEYFQPNIAKPLHIGHLRTAIIGDAIRRCLEYVGHKVESDTHMGDWGTQFGLLILAYKKYGNAEEVAKDPIPKLNEYYIKINQDAEADPAVHETGKQEFVKLEQGDEENRTIWKKFVDLSMEKFLKINDLMDILAFDHHWPESFFEDKMPQILEDLKAKGLLVESQGAQIVNLEEQGLGVAVIVKSDGGTTYLLRDLATYKFRKNEGFAKQLYVVDNRQAHHYRQLFAILKMLGEMTEGDAAHIDYGFISFKGEVLSTRKGNMVLAEDVINEAKAKVANIIEQKNPELAGKAEVVDAVSKGALKYYDLSHNRHSDIEFDWDVALDFEGNSGPYLQYTYARLSSILRKAPAVTAAPIFDISQTEHQLALEATKLPDAVIASLQDYLPNLLANYLYGLANLANKFYHESPVLAEEDATKQAFRLALVAKVREVLGTGLNLLGIKTPEEM